MCASRPCTDPSGTSRSSWRRSGAWRATEGEGTGHDPNLAAQPPRQGLLVSIFVPDSERVSGRLVPWRAAMNDVYFMDLAIAEAQASIGRTSPNPPVGAAIVRQERVLSTGRTAPAGGPHAEIVAMGLAREDVKGATVYTTLEPCCHEGRTGPCTDVLIAAGIVRVVVGCLDRNPRVSGKGISALRAAGIEVELGVRGSTCETIARPFFTWVEKGRPYVVLKAAITLDGRIATPEGHSKWITGEPARERAHGWRNRFDAVLVGAGTVLADDPALTCRLNGGEARDPVRIVLDGRLRTSPESRIYRQSSSAPTWLVTSEDVDEERLKPYLGPSVDVIRLPSREGRVEMASLTRELASRDIVSLLVEGGADVHGGFLGAGLVDELRLFIAPKVLGAGLAWVAFGRDRQPSTIGDAFVLARPSTEAVGDDLLLVSHLAT